MRRKHRTLQASPEADTVLGSARPNCVLYEFCGPSAQRNKCHPHRTPTLNVMCMLRVQQMVCPGKAPGQGQDQQGQAPFSPMAKEGQQGQCPGKPENAVAMLRSPHLR